MSPPAVATALALNETLPRFDGLQVHVTKWFDPETEVGLLMQPGTGLPFAVNVILEI